ncbi:hypothetical protein Pla175_23130 [Pirellulimonas nuda]|uniref:LamG-like jellyroll fold domain-containing protein n=1 Tax=Pirellulimonas nuda TaxID=2528009 RepID=A0A518DBT8_9BACT|nr:LamG-like jellyroll fold domain-containing protein [Pirellulimonas nuda]QDU88929.1 hypothetical protein Pla175_23130 [Pirellulimonas nuda]
MMRNSNHLWCRTLPIALLAFIPVAKADLVHYWSFDEGSGTTTADSIGTATGVIDGATWATGTGNRATFLSFDGNNDRVDPSLSFPTITTEDSSSWTFWVNLAPGTAATSNEIIIGNRKDGNNVDIGPGTRNFLKITPRGRFNFHQGGGHDVDFAPFPTDTWTHFAFSREGDQLTWYIDGVAANGGVPSTIPGLATSATGAILPFYMGGEPALAGAEHFAGGLDDVRIYNHALTAQEVLQSMLPFGLPIPGDANDDGVVNEADLTIVRNNYFNNVTGTPVERFLAGDMNLDSIVDFRDYRIWKDNYVPSALGLASDAVPEPTALGLALFAGVTLSALRRRA